MGATVELQLTKSKEKYDPSCEGFCLDPVNPIIVKERPVKLYNLKRAVLPCKPSCKVSLSIVHNRTPERLKTY